jgi:hypothetical protein
MSRGYRALMPTRAWLAGHDHDLRYLAVLLPGGDVRVGQDGDRFFLAAKVMEAPRGCEQFHDAARRLIAWANGLASVLSPDFTPVQLTDAYDHDGGVTVVAGAAHAMVRAPAPAGVGAVTGPDGQVAPQPPPPGSGYLALAARDSDVAEALKIMAAVPHFPELYKVREIVRSTGGLKAAMVAAGISENQMETFKRTADHQAASGEHSRHARATTQPPARPMAIADARAMFGRLVVAWMAAR